MSHVLVVEDRASLRRMMQLALEQDGHAVTCAACGNEGIEQVERDRFDLVLTDLELPGASGIDVVRASRRHQPQTPVVILTAFGTVAHAVEAMKLGAADFLEKPLEIDDLSALVGGLTESGGSGDGVFEPPGAPPIIGRHPALRAAIRQVEKVAPTDSTVLLTGESGTGKELFARAVHALSARASGPFVAVNCAAIPEALIENELFGHEKGAFTGAGRRQAGRFELAEGGTLMLDEIGELAMPVQGKVLRVLEERTYERVGGGRTRMADVRIVAATNRDLQTLIDEGRFRSDLYYRLDVFPIHLPPVRARRTDIPALARHLIDRCAERLKRESPMLGPDAAAYLRTQPWPGNVRQLANAIERAVILSSGNHLRRADFDTVPEPVDTGTPEADDERGRIRRALTEADGDKPAAAARLGISYRTLQRKIRALDLEGYPQYRS